MAELVEGNSKEGQTPVEQRKDLMSNLKKLESMMKEYTKHKKKSDQERIKEIKVLSDKDIELTKVNLFFSGHQYFYLCPRETL